MILNGFDEKTMKKVFNFFLNDSITFEGKRKRGFVTRILPHSGKGNNAILNEAQINESEKEFKNSMAFLYLKTFYGKRPEKFKTLEFKQECERLHSVILESSNPSALRSKIEECLRKGHVDYNSGELPHNLFYKRLSKIGLATDDLDHSIFISPKFIAQARIYINPSQKDYSHLMKFLYERAAAEELEIGTKTRLLDIGSYVLDNMIIYTSAKDFPKIVNILNDYGKKFPDKVAQFGDTIECLGRGEQDWFGFGFETQRDAFKPHGISTFNCAIDDLFNFYILPIVAIDNFDKITKGMNETQLVDIFMNTCKNPRIAKEVALSLQNSTFRRQFIENFRNLTNLREISMGYTRDNAKLSVKERNGCSPEQLRFSIKRGDGGSIIEGQFDDFVLLQNEIIKIPLINGSSVVFSRNEIAKIIESPILRNAMKEFYDIHNNMVFREVVIMTVLLEYAAKNMPYLNEKYPFLTDEMVKEIEKYEKNASLSEKNRSEQKEIIENLCGKRVKLETALLDFGVPQEKITYATREDLEKLYITKVGLDETIEAANYVKSQETPESEIIHRYENSLQALRHKRGQELCYKIKRLPTKEERNDFISPLSDFEKEDMTTEYKWSQNMSNAVKDLLCML